MSQTETGHRRWRLEQQVLLVKSVYIYNVVLVN